MMMKPKIPPKRTQKGDTRRREELLDEIEYLCAKNDYLKKRRALIQAEQAASLSSSLSRTKEEEISYEFIPMNHASSNRTGSITQPTL